jgi:hypothetical protein
MSREGIEAQADYRIKKGAKEARRRNARLVAARRAIREAGAIDFACCPVHGLHGQRNECYVCGEEVEIVAMVPVAERDALQERIDAAIVALSREGMPSVRNRTALRILTGDTR